jgi:hypothetical protein
MQLSHHLRVQERGKLLVDYKVTNRCYRQLSIIESSDEDDEEVIKSPSSKKKFNLSRIDSSPESDT